MIGYASHTTNRRNLAALRAAGWRLIISAAARVDKQRADGFPYGIDNGAWTAFQRGESFDAARFERTVDKFGHAADWIVVPDIVAGGQRSLDFSLGWIDRLRGAAPLLLAVQDGMTPEQIAPLVGPALGIFVGGSTAWKIRTIPVWGGVAEATACWFHVGRVNTARRIRHCAIAGAHSFDGTSATRWAETLPLLDNAVRQIAFRLD